MTTLAIISLVIFLVYMAIVVKMFGVPWSISNTYYMFENKKKGLGWLFTTMCWAVSGTLLPVLLEVTQDRYQFTAFLACAGMMFVGAAPQFKLSLTGSVHYGGAAVCVIFSQLWVGLTCWWVLIPFWVAYMVYTVVSMRKHKTGHLWYDFVETKPMTWVEVTAIGSTFLTVSFELI